jgi:2-oxoglutarate ferredoxin oxidoreductase subunit gamma
MTESLVIAGFGGQGVLFAGQLVAHAALAVGRHTTWYPSYGPEMRGGTAHCIVVVSDEPIGSPVVAHPSAAIIMNLPSLDRFESTLEAGGLLVVNASLVDRAVRRDDLETVLVHADDEAALLGDARLATMLLLGALLERRPIVPIDGVAATLERVLPERRKALLGANRAALARGAELARAARAARTEVAPV